MINLLNASEGVRLQALDDGDEHVVVVVDPLVASLVVLEQRRRLLQWHVHPLDHSLGSLQPEDKNLLLAQSVQNAVALVVRQLILSDGTLVFLQQL